jgi:membrane dipeptidase
MSKTIGVDMHNHVYPAGTEPHPRQALPRQDEQPPSPALSMAEEIKLSGLTAVCASFVLHFTPTEKPGDSRDNFLRWLTAIDAQLARAACAAPTIVQTVEGAQFIEGRLDRVKEVYKRGVRHLQLLHEHDDKVSPLEVIRIPPPLILAA